MNTIKCPKCNTENLMTHIKCDKCGYKLISDKIVKESETKATTETKEEIYKKIKASASQRKTSGIMFCIIGLCCFPLGLLIKKLAEGTINFEIIGIIATIFIAGIITIYYGKREIDKSNEISSNPENNSEIMKKDMEEKEKLHQLLHRIIKIIILIVLLYSMIQMVFVVLPKSYSNFKEINGSIIITLSIFYIILTIYIIITLVRIIKKLLKKD